MMFLLHLSAGRHLVPNTPTDVDMFLRREFPRFSLFSYYHKFTHNWVICEWVSKERGVAIEVLVLGPLPMFWSRAQVEELGQRLNQPVHREDMGKHMQAEETARMARNDADEAELADLLAKVKRDYHPGRGAGKTLFLPAHLAGDFQRRRL